MDTNKKYNHWNGKNLILMIILTILCITCFPVNFLVLMNIISVPHYPLLFIIGWISWGIGMLLVISPFIMFPKYGEIKKGESFVDTRKVVDRGIYSIVRHPQYLGGIFSIFVINILWHPHWLFLILGTAGVIILYFSCIEEEKILINRFGSDYADYMKKVPRMNIMIGIIRAIKRKKNIN